MKTTLFALLLCTPFLALAQGKYFTRNATITFFSSTPMEDIKAENFGATAVLDAGTGAMEWSVLMKSFNFKKALMQEHFNENYVESDKFPKASFKGNIENLDDLNLSKDGSYKAKVNGNMTIHGVTKPVSTEGDIVVKGGKIQMNSIFMLAPEDYDISIPSVVRDKIAKEVEVKVSAMLDPLDK